MPSFFILFRCDVTPTRFYTQLLEKSLIFTIIIGNWTLAMGEKRSQTRSRFQSRESRRRRDEKWEKSQAQVDNLTKFVGALVWVQYEQKLSENFHDDSVSPKIVTGKIRYLHYVVQAFSTFHTNVGTCLPIRRHQVHTTLTSGW